MCKQYSPVHSFIHSFILKGTEYVLSTGKARGLSEMDGAALLPVRTSIDKPSGSELIHPHGDGAEHSK